MSKLKDSIESIRLGLPEKFFLKLEGDPGLYYKTKENSQEKICDPIAVTATKSNINKANFGREITFWNEYGEERTSYISKQTLLDSKETLRTLVYEGFNAPTTYEFRRLLLSYLNQSQPAERIIEIEKTGWVNENFDIYICPSFTASKEGSSTKERIILSQGLKSSRFAMKGTLEEWQKNVCKYCENNENLTLILCASFGSLVLKPLRLNGALYHLVGRSSTGKTTAAYVAASVFGSYDFVKAWRLTSNGLEGIAECHNDATLVLDELSQVNSKEAGNSLYMLINGSGKIRSNKEGNPKPIKTWRLNVISTGEVCIADKIIESGERVKGGQTVRAIDIYAEIPEGFGIYNDLHGLPGGGELSNLLKQNTSLYYGVPMFEFAKGIVIKEGSIKTLEEIYKTSKERLYDHFKLEEADGQVQRVADSFAGNIAAGIYASSDYLGILTHNCVAIEEDNFKIFDRWLENRGSKKSQEEEHVINHIREYLEQNNNRFAHTKSTCSDDVTDAKSYNNPLGLVYNNSYDKKNTYYLFTGAFKNEICNGFDVKITKQILLKRGILELDVDQKSNKRCPYNIYKNKRMVTLTFIDF